MLVYLRQTSYGSISSVPQLRLGKKSLDAIAFYLLCWQKAIVEFTFIKRRFFPDCRAARLAVVIGFTLAVPACATIMSGTTERIRFESVPSGAQVAINGDKYTTPVEVKLARKKNYEATFEVPGYIPATRQVTKGNNLWILGNILIGGVIGILVDFATGAAQDLRPDVVRVTLVEKPRPAVPADSP